jgi:methionyl-tRNA formyltransferase
MGYGEVGNLCLKSLVSAGIKVTAVIPRSSDNGTNSSANSVFNFARETGIEILSHKSVRAKPFAAALSNLEYIVSVQYDRILDENWLSIPKFDTLNLHFSFLPRLRGCYPTKWAIIEEKSTGVTLHSVDTGIDTGDILDQQEVEIAPDDTDETLYSKLSLSAVELFRKNIPNLINKSFPGRRKQANGQSSYHPKKLPFEGILDLENDLNFCHRFLRAFTFPPFPPAYCYLGKVEVGLYAPLHKDKGTQPTKPGKFHLSKDNLLAVECKDGTMYFDTMQVEGKQISPVNFFNRNLF